MPPKLANAKRTKRSNPALKAGLDLMAQLGGIQVLGTASQPYYYFPPAVRVSRGIERCVRCVQACGSNAACNVQPFVRVSGNIWKSRKCHYCTIYPAESEGDKCGLDGRLYIFDVEARSLSPVSESGEPLTPLNSSFEISLGGDKAVAHAHCNVIAAPVTPPPEKEEVSVLPDVPQPSTPELKSQDVPEPVTPPTATMSSFGLYTPVATPSLEKSEKSRELMPQVLDVVAPAPVSTTIIEETAKKPVKPAVEETAKPVEKTPASIPKPIQISPAQQFLQRIAPSPTTATAFTTPAAAPAVEAADVTPAQQFLQRLAIPAPEPAAAPALAPAPVLKSEPKPVVALAPVSLAPVSAPTPVSASASTSTLPSKPKSDRRPVALGLAPIWGNKPSFDREAPPTPKLSSFAASTSAPSTPSLTPSATFSSTLPASLPVPVASYYRRASVAGAADTVDPISQLVSSRRPAAVLAAVGDALHSELATLDDIGAAIAELKRLLAIKEEEHAAQLRKVDSYRFAIDDALTAIDEEQKSLRTMRARLAGALL